jgi:alpha-1,2-mannosyltransferase
VGDSTGPPRRFLLTVLRRSADTVPAPHVSTSRLPFTLILVAVAAIAFTARLVPVLRGSGLYGLGNYDDGVYYAAATALVHGQLPYRDFLFLQPPGITVVLAPFALLGRLITDAHGFAAARLAWMLLGVVNTALVGRILRPLGLAAAATGGLFYALFYPAVYTEHTTLLEAPPNTALLLAVLLVNRSHDHPETGARRSHRLLISAGVLLGLSAGIKIWGVVVIVLLVGWVLATRGVRPGRSLLLGVIAGGLAVYLPFFAQAPVVMWNEVVRDQLGRDNQTTSTATRLAYITGLGSFHPAHPSYVMITIAIAALVLAACLAWLTPQVRLAVVLLVGLSIFLLLVPTWFSHYAGLIAPPAAVVVGAGAAQVIARLQMTTSRPRANALVGLTAAAALVCACLYALPLTRSAWGQRFPGRSFASVTSSASGCVTADDPTALIETNTLSRNLTRGCRTVVDLAGYSHDGAATTHIFVKRLRDSAWQRTSLDYLRSGSAAFVVRFDDGTHFNARTRAILTRWPLLAEHGSYELRSPQP